MQNFSYDKEALFRRLEEYKAQIDADTLKRKEEKRAARIAGKLPEKVYDALRTCTIPQLLEAKKLCHQFITDQKNAPRKVECQKSFVLAVLLSIPVRAKRYQYEIIRNTKRAEKLYVNGPYWNVYWRDGKIVKNKRIKKKDARFLPRKVRDALKQYLENHDPKQELEAVRQRSGISNVASH